MTAAKISTSGHGVRAAVLDIAAAATATATASLLLRTLGCALGHRRSAGGAVVARYERFPRRCCRTGLHVPYQRLQARRPGGFSSQQLCRTDLPRQTVEPRYSAEQTCSSPAYACRSLGVWELASRRLCMWQPQLVEPPSLPSASSSPNPARSTHAAWYPIDRLRLPSAGAAMWRRRRRPPTLPARAWRS